MEGVRVKRWESDVGFGSVRRFMKYSDLYTQGSIYY